MSSRAGGGSASYFDPKIGARAISVLPGHHDVTQEADVAVTTLLGSCVAACIRAEARRAVSFAGCVHAWHVATVNATKDRRIVTAVGGSSSFYFAAARLYIMVSCQSVRGAAALFSRSSGNDG